MNIVFTYSIQKVNIEQATNIDVKDVTINELMNKLFEPLGIDYKVFNNRSIVLSKGKNSIDYQGVTLSGQVQNDDGQLLQFVNVILTEPNDNKILQGKTTEEFGRFTFENLKYKPYHLKLSYIGYKSFDTIIDMEQSLNIGTIQLAYDANMMDELKISARRKIVKQQLDRLIINVEHSMLASRGNALDVLRSTPGVSVNNDQISMIGKSSVRLMIDEKIIDIPNDDLADFLRSISSESISNIEVITMPPSKYDAEGNSGLINIIMKKAKLDSWNSSIKLGYKQRYKETENIGFNFNYNKNKFNFASSLYYVEGNYYQEQDDYAHFDDGLWYTSSPLLNQYKRLNGRVDMTYQLTDNWSIGGQYMHNQSKMDVTDSPYTPVYDYDSNEILRYLQSTNSEMHWRPKINAIDLNTKINLDTSGRNLILKLDYFDYQNDDKRIYEGESIIISPSQKQFYAGINKNLQQIKNISGAIDFEWPSSIGKLEFGGKLSRSIAENDILSFNSGLVNDKVSSLPLGHNDFEYIENLQAFYLSGSKKINDKFQLKLGLRLEAIQSTSVSVSFKLDESDRQTKIFPTVYFQYKWSEQSNYSISYNKRVHRPNFGELNPNTFYINPFQTISGNSFLQPSYMDNLELSAVTRDLTSKLYFNYQKDIFTQVPLPNPVDNTISFINLNYINTKRIGLTESYIYDRLDWWTSTNSVDVNYSISEVFLDNTPKDLRGYNSRISTYNDFSIKAIDGLSISLGYSYKFTGYYGLLKMLPTSNLSTSIQYLLMDKNLKISLSGNDLLKDQADRTEALVNGVFQTARYYYDSRSVSLNVVYNFGNKNISANRYKSSNQEERSRTGG